MERVRRALERLYTGTLTVIFRATATDPETKREKIEEVILYENQPCNLSDILLSPTDKGDTPAVIQKKKLFCAPELQIPAGSKIVVTQHGNTSYWKMSGEPSVRANHQEILLNIWKEWA